MKKTLRNIRPGLNKGKQVNRQTGQQGFTLVELIIVIAIIAVLAVAAFMMLTKWLGKSRDSRRLSDLGTISRGLTVGYSDTDDGINMYPDIMHQDDKIGLMSGDEVVGYQGRVDSEVVKGASMQKVPLDPSDQNEYTYLVTQNRQKFQVLGMLEDGTEVGVLNDVFALDYKNRVPSTKGFELGVLLHKDSNLPIQYAGESFTGIDLMDGEVRENYKAIVNDNIVQSGTGIALAPIVNEDTILIVKNEENTTSTGTCAARPEYNNISFTDGNPTEENTQWTKTTDTNIPCRYTCIGGHRGEDCSLEPAKNILLIHSNEDYTNFDPNEDFTGVDGSDVSNSAWRFTDNNNKCSIDNNRLKITTNGTEGNHEPFCNLDGRNRWGLYGDFDIQMTIDDGTGTAQSSILQIQNSSNYHVGRVDRRTFFNPGRNVLSVGQVVDAYDVRLTRVGNTLTAYYKLNDGTDNWAGAASYVEPTSLTEPRRDVFLYFFNSGSGVTTKPAGDRYIDDFKINSGNPYIFKTLDSSSLANALTLNGSVRHNGNEKAVGNSSLEFDGDGDYLSIADSEDLYLGSDDFTIETWVKFNDLGARRGLVQQWESGNTANQSWVLVKNNNHTLRFGARDTDGNALFDIGSTTVMETGKWYHIAVTRHDNTARFFVNGKVENTNTNAGGALQDIGLDLLIGASHALGATTTGSHLDGYMDEVRIRKGEAVRTEDFDLPTSPY